MRLRNLYRVMFIITIQIDVPSMTNTIHIYAYEYDGILCVTYSSPPCGMSNTTTWSINAMIVSVVRINACSANFFSSVST